MIGNRQRHRHLAIVRLAEPPAILTSHANRMNPLLGKARVIDNPRLDRAMAHDRRHDQLAHLAQYRFVRPRSLTHKMQKRLVLGRDPRGRHHGGHRLDTLALAGQQQARAIIPQRQSSIRMPNHPAQQFDIRHKTRLAPLVILIHQRRPKFDKPNSSTYQTTIRSESTNFHHSVVVANSVQKVNG